MTSPPRSSGHLPNCGFLTSRLAHCPFFTGGKYETIKLGMLAVILIQNQTGLKTQMCAGRLLCKLLPLQKFGVAHLELYCGICVIFFWINTSLKNSQIGLSSDSVTSVPGTTTQGLGAEGKESMWISGALTFGIMTWGNKAAQASSSLSGMLSHRQKHCLAQDALWLCHARDVVGLGLLLAGGTGTGV